MVLDKKQFAASAGHGSHDSRIAAEVSFVITVRVYHDASVNSDMLCREP